MPHVNVKIYAKDKALFERLKQIPRTELLDTKVEDIPFGVRAQNALAQAGVVTLRELIATKKMRLLRIRNMGRKSVSQIEVYLEELGLTLDTPPYLVETGAVEVAPYVDALKALDAPVEAIPSISDLDAISEEDDVEQPTGDTSLRLNLILQREQRLAALMGEARNLLKRIEAVLR